MMCLLFLNLNWGKDLENYLLPMQLKNLWWKQMHILNPQNFSESVKKKVSKILIYFENLAADFQYPEGE